jgi:hypothetical protein
LGHVQESDDLGDDISSKLSCGFRIDRPYVNKVAAALKQEETGATDTIRSTPFFRSLSSFIENGLHAVSILFAIAFGLVLPSMYYTKRQQPII